MKFCLWDHTWGQHKNWSLQRITPNMKNPNTLTVSGCCGTKTRWSLKTCWSHYSSGLNSETFCINVVWMFTDKIFQFFAGWPFHCGIKGRGSKQAFPRPDEWWTVPHRPSKLHLSWRFDRTLQKTPHLQVWHWETLSSAAIHFPVRLLKASKIRLLSLKKNGEKNFKTERNHHSIFTKRRKVAKKKENTRRWLWMETSAS